MRLKAPDNRNGIFQKCIVDLLIYSPIVLGSTIDIQYMVYAKQSVLNLNTFNIKNLQLGVLVPEIV